MEGRKQSMYSVKVIVIGDSGVGKTNLITRFC
jgi:GTPase SAR1 family protein